VETSATMSQRAALVNLRGATVADRNLGEPTALPSTDIDVWTSYPMCSWLEICQSPRYLPGDRWR
jgi:hypothetical protein